MKTKIQILLLAPACLAGSSNATPINCGQTLNGTISAAGQTDSYTFSGTAGEAVVISAHSSSGSLGAAFDLYGSAGNLITSVFQGSSGSVSLPTTGTYTILVHDQIYANTGSYWISLVNSVPSFSSPVSLSKGGFQMQLNGVTGRNYTLLATTNVALPISNWFTVLITNLSGNSAILQDNHATNRSRFYRAVQVP